MQQVAEVKSAIILTLAYTDQFKYPLTTQELWVRLIGCQPTVADFIASLRELLANNVIHSFDGHWSLADNQRILGRPNRMKRARLSKEKITSFQPVVKLARVCPWIAGLAITGSVSMRNASKDDDVDVMVVAENNRLWLVRPALILLSFIYGKRRSWQGEEPNSWCFNLWLERQSLSLAKHNRSLYSAYEACQADWLVSKGNLHWEFLQSNRWINKILPRFFVQCEYTPTQYGYIHDTTQIPLLREVFNILNVVAFQLQQLYMSRHITTERVGYTSAFFHPRDTRNQITHGLQQQINLRLVGSVAGK